MNNLKKCLFVILLLSAILAHPETNQNELQLLQFEEKIRNLSENRLGLQIEKELLEIKLKDITSVLQERKNLLKLRLKALSRLNKFEWGSLLVNNDISKIERNLHLVVKLTKSDLNLIKDYKKNLQQIQLAKKNILDTEKLLSQNIQALQEEQKKFLATEKKHIAFLQTTNTNSFLLQKGKLARPLDSLPKSEFGTVRNKNNLFYLFNQGELYETKKETPIKAVGLGKVIFRDRLESWNETLIVEHASGYYSIYAGVKNSKMAIGDQVQADEILGKSSADEFYFELRHLHSAINPKNWYQN